MANQPILFAPPRSAVLKHALALGGVAAAREVADKLLVGCVNPGGDAAQNCFGERIKVVTASSRQERHHVFTGAKYRRHAGHNVKRRHAAGRGAWVAGFAW